VNLESSSRWLYSLCGGSYANENKGEYMKNKGIYIILEGGEGTGKGTQQAILEHYYLLNGRRRVIKTHEPGGGFGPQLRQMLLGAELEHVSPHTKALTELHLFLADRACHMTKVKQWLANDYVVIQDRGSGSSIAYQGYGRGLSTYMIRQMSDDVMDGISPNVTILLDASPKDLRERIERRGNLSRFDRESLGFHQKVRKGFLDQATQNSSWAVVCALGTEEEVFMRIQSVLNERKLL